MKTKLILASTLCIATALGLVTLAVEHHTLKLAAQERERVQAMYTSSKENELKHYVNLAKTAIQKIAKSDQDEAKMQRQALGVLSQMHFGNDGYFFIYDRLGNLLLDPSQMGLQGVDFCEPDQPVGENQAKLLLQTASQGGGIVRYLWQKPSSQVMAPKMSYVIPVGQWGWILGAGMYLDDVEATLRQIDQDAQQNIEDTQQSIFWIAALSIVLMGLAGLAMNLSNHRVASEKLQRLAQRLVRSQEDERVRVARELHDGVVQVMVSSKFLLEAAQVQLQQTQQAPTPAAQPAARSPHRLLEQGVNRLNDALHEIHRVSHGLRPALLDDLGLAAALELLVTQSREQFPFALQWSRQGQPVELPTAHGTALFRVVQEALTNAHNHARASSVEIRLSYETRRVRLRIADNGCGFDLARVQADAQGGIGLRNMRERIESLGGTFAMASGAHGTAIDALLPLGDQHAPRHAIVPTIQPAT